MITDKVIQAIEASLDAKFTAHVVPEGEAYPTSGSTFIRVTGDYTDINMTEGNAIFTVLFSVMCSIRTRDFTKQTKRTPYYTLLDLQERVFLHLTSDLTLTNSLYAIADSIGVVGRFTSTKINTRVQALDPSFYGSTDYSSHRETGYLLSQSYFAPQLHIPVNCLTYPEPLASATP